MAAQKADTPRWGDYPEKLDLKYIQNLIDTGIIKPLLLFKYITIQCIYLGYWFDGKKVVVKTNPEMEPDFAPKYVLENWERYKNWLVPDNSTRKS